MNYNIALSEEKNTDILKWIAIITMLIDHIGKVFYPQIILLRIIGRISFPIFTYLIALGYKRTSSYEDYLRRLLIFAFISIIPYHYFSYGNNIFFTLAAGLVTIHYLQKKNYIIPLGMIMLSEYMNMSYGWYGVIMILVFSMFLNDYKKLVISFLLLNLGYFLFRQNITQLYSILVLLILPMEYDLKYRLPRYFYYWFYPVHITILLMIQSLIIKL